MSEFKHPWVAIRDSAENLEQELQRELSPAHVLYGYRARAVARRADNDDVLFSIDRSDTPLALVHLTWSGRHEADPSWPYTVLLRSVDELADES